jgi:hypothetical protein
VNPVCSPSGPVVVTGGHDGVEVDERAVCGCSKYGDARIEWVHVGPVPPGINGRDRADGVQSLWFLKTGKRHDGELPRSSCCRPRSWTCHLWIHDTIREVRRGRGAVQGIMTTTFEFGRPPGSASIA